IVVLLGWVPEGELDGAEVDVARLAHANGVGERSPALHDARLRLDRLALLGIEPLDAPALRHAQGLRPGPRALAARRHRDRSTLLDRPRLDGRLERELSDVADNVARRPSGGRRLGDGNHEII